MAEFEMNINYLQKFGGLLLIIGLVVFWIGCRQPQPSKYDIGNGSGNTPTPWEPTSATLRFESNLPPALVLYSREGADHVVTFEAPDDQLQAVSVVVVSQNGNRVRLTALEVLQAIGNHVGTRKR